MSGKTIKKVSAGIALMSIMAGGAYTYHAGLEAKAEAAVIASQAKEEADVYTASVQEYRKQIGDLQNQNTNLQNENAQLKNQVEVLRREVERGYSGDFEVEVTAYTLSESDCGKGASHPGYGVTANGTNLAGHTLESARAIAVDPRVIPLGSKVRINFKDEEMRQYNGVYTAVDTGGAIKGNIIDLFAGEGADSLADHIGRRIAKVTVLS